MRVRALLAVLALGLLSVSGAVWATMTPENAPAVPVAPVQRGRIDVTVRATGDIRASRAVQVFAPPAGGTLTIVSLAPTGAALRAGDTVVTFDSADQEFALEQAKSDLALAEQEIIKAEAQAAVQAAEDQVALLKARYAVRRAELDASGNELVGAIVAKQNLLLLEEARQKLAQLEKDVASHREATRASTNVLREKANKSRVAVSVAERNIQNLEIVAPFDGFVTVRQNMMAMGGVIFSGAVMPDFRVGDSAFPGNAIADLVDTSRMEVTAKLSERDRANVETGQAASVVVDGLPAAALDGKVRAVSSVASRRVFEAGGTRQFDIAFDILRAPARVWPGTSAAITISGATFDAALSVPRSAVFDVGGTPTVYVRTAAGFDPRPVKVRAWTEAVAVIDDIDPSAMVALVDPTKAGATSAPATPARPVAGTGVAP
jgi:multidrug efflux pump subunit AcrA (membrane-fusion protein)